MAATEAMEETVTTNGRKGKTVSLSLEEGGNTTRHQKQRIGLLPTVTEQTSVTYHGKVVGESTWSQLPARKLFAVDSSGSRLYFKISKSSYCDLVTEEVVTNVPATASNKVYRVSLV